MTTQLMDAFEERVTRFHVTRGVAHRVLGVSKTSWFEYRKGDRPMPEYIACSIRAHLKLTAADMQHLIDERTDNETPSIGPEDM